MRLAPSGGMGSLRTVHLGEIGENLACAALEQRGYAIIARRYRTRVGEIDVVAVDGRTLVFVEVKTRASTRCGLPAEAVTRWKQQRIVTMALSYLAGDRRHPGPIRFDVVSVLMRPDGPPIVDVMRGAFTADCWQRR